MESWSGKPARTTRFEVFAAKGAAVLGQHLGDKVILAAEPLEAGFDAVSGTILHELAHETGGEEDIRFLRRLTLLLGEALRSPEKVRTARLRYANAQPAEEPPADGSATSPAYNPEHDQGIDDTEGVVVTVLVPPAFPPTEALMTTLRAAAAEAGIGIWVTAASISGAVGAVTWQAPGLPTLMVSGADVEPPAPGDAALGLPAAHLRRGGDRGLPRPRGHQGGAAAGQGAAADGEGPGSRCTWGSSTATASASRRCSASRCPAAARAKKKLAARGARRARARLDAGSHHRRATRAASTASGPTGGSRRWTRGSRAPGGPALGRDGLLRAARPAARRGRLRGGPARRRSRLRRRRRPRARGDGRGDGGGRRRLRPGGGRPRGEGPRPRRGRLPGGARRAPRGCSISRSRRRPSSPCWRTRWRAPGSARRPTPPRGASTGRRSRARSPPPRPRRCGSSA